MHFIFILFFKCILLPEKFRLLRYLFNGCLLLFHFKIQKHDHWCTKRNATLGYQLETSDILDDATQRNKTTLGSF